MRPSHSNTTAPVAQLGRPMYTGNTYAGGIISTTSSPAKGGHCARCAAHDLSLGPGDTSRSSTTPRPSSCASTRPPTASSAKAAGHQAEFVSVEEAPGHALGAHATRFARRAGFTRRRDAAEPRRSTILFWGRSSPVPSVPSASAGDGQRSAADPRRSTVLFFPLPPQWGIGSRQQKQRLRAPRRRSRPPSRGGCSFFRAGKPCALCALRHRR